MIADRFWELLSKKVFAEANDCELKEFEEFLSAHPDLKDTAEALTALGHQSRPTKKNREAELAFEKHIQKITDSHTEHDETFILTISETETENKVEKWKRVRKWTIPLAATFVILLLLLVFKNNITSSYSVPKNKS
ncbi:MAG TPA: hypothetical protein VGG71_01280, partial [Chitinophagaceae bacterium]